MTQFHKLEMFQVWTAATRSTSAEDYRQVNLIFKCETHFTYASALVTL